MAASEVVGEAQLKLLSSREFNPLDERQVFSTFANRILLELSDTEASTRMALNAVQSHMRVLTAVVDGVVVTQAPSEPILAIAAAQALNQKEEDYTFALNTLLDELIMRGVVKDRGLQGELYGRLLLTLARDKATIAHGGVFLNGVRVTAVAVSSLLQSLLGKRAIGTPGLGLPFAQAGLCDQLLTFGSNVWVNFTHFVQLDDELDEIPHSLLYDAWCRGAAFQCVFHQAAIDGLIVTYSGDLDAPFDRNKLSYIVWQAKAKDEPVDSDLCNDLSGPFIYDDTLPPDERVRYKPVHVAILMDIGIRRAFRVGGTCNLTFGVATRATGKGRSWNGYAAGKDVEQPRYCLNVRGHTETQYPIIEGHGQQFERLFLRALGCSHTNFFPYAARSKEDLQPFRLRKD